MMWKVASLIGFCLALTGCDDTVRTLAGGDSIDALKKVKTVSDRAEQQGMKRFDNGMDLDSRSRDIEEAAKE